MHDYDHYEQDGGQCACTCAAPRRLWWLPLVAAAIVSYALIGPVEGQQRLPDRGSLWPAPWDDFDNSLVVRTYYGDVRGFSVPWHVEDEAWNPEWDEQPRWFVQRINCWLGVPYAEPPLGKLRFQRPRRPRWGKTWNATYFRHACPQDVEHIRQDIPDFPARNVSEDCLYLNVFAPNVTWHSLHTLYPVVVFIHGGDFLYGTAQTYPGHVLVRQEVVVVTLNYRLGAFGFLTTEDEHAQGNWGLWDQQLALEFIRENIKAFRGDPAKITLMGDGAGAASAGLHIISPASKDRHLFHQAILMSGSDMAGMAIVDPFWRPHEYAFELGGLLDCDTRDSHLLLECLRDNRRRPWQDVVTAQALVQPHDGALGQVWAPTQDGGYYTDRPFMPETPVDLRRQSTFAKIPVMVGINQQDGVTKADRLVQGLAHGMFEVTMENFLRKQLQSWRVMDRYWQRALEAVRFQYTYWPDPKNRTAIAQEFINLVTDLDFGRGMDSVIKYHAPYESSYQYVWSYKSWDDYQPHWMGAYRRAQIPYVFGFPFMNETVLNETGLVMRQWYDYEDRNMSDCTMLMWTNFIKYTVPTPNVTCNVTWEPFLENNLTYLVLDYHKHMWFRYRQAAYGFWKGYYPIIARQDYLRPTATPTPVGYDYVYVTGTVGTVFCISLLVVGVCVYLLILQSRREDAEPYTESEMPLSFSRSQSAMTVSTTRERQSPDEFAAPYGRHYMSYHTSQSEI